MIKCLAPWVALLLLASCSRQPEKNQVAATFHVEELPADHKVDLSQRKVFPFSIVPGGTVSAGEVKAKVAADPVVRQHYANLNLGQLKPFRLSQPASAYLSYRIGNRVFWTTRRMYLKPGELLLSDGANLLRGRCGNRISTVPQHPILPGAEPTEATFDQPSYDVPVFQALSEDALGQLGDSPLFKLPGNLPPPSLTDAAALPAGSFAVAPPLGLIGGGFPGAWAEPRDPGGEIRIQDTAFFPVWSNPPNLEVPGLVVNPWLPLQPPGSTLNFQTYDYTPIGFNTPILIAFGIPLLPGHPGGPDPLHPPGYLVPDFPIGDGTHPFVFTPPADPGEVNPPGESNPQPHPVHPETEKPPELEPIPEPNSWWLAALAVLLLLNPRVRLWLRPAPCRSSGVRKPR